MHRVLALGLVIVCAGAGPAAASSFVSAPAISQAARPSIVTLGLPEAPSIDARPLAASATVETQGETPSIYVISPSVVAFGADAIPRAREAVASIDETTEKPAPGWRHEAVPLVIRGGVIGEAIVSASDTAATETPLDEARTPGKPQEQQRAPKRSTPEPQAAPAPPTRLPD